MLCTKWPITSRLKKVGPSAEPLKTAKCGIERGEVTLKRFFPQPGRAIGTTGICQCVTTNDRIEKMGPEGRSWPIVVLQLQVPNPEQDVVVCFGS